MLVNWDSLLVLRRNWAALVEDSSVENEAQDKNNFLLDSVVDRDEDVRWVDKDAEEIDSWVVK